LPKGTKHLLARLSVGNPLPLTQLPLRKVDVAKELELFYQAFVLTDFKDDSSAMPSLGKHQGALRLAKAFDEGGGLGPELGDGFDVFGKMDSSHNKSIAYF
jgi:hypothetical protein